MLELEQTIDRPIPQLYDEIEQRELWSSGELGKSREEPETKSRIPHGLLDGENSWMGRGLSSRAFAFVTCEGTVTGLSLAHARIAEVPSPVFRLSSIRTLLLNSNCIGELPSVICNLTNLTNLQIEDNPIEILPSSLATLHELSHLNIFDTKLHPLPAVLLELLALKKVAIDATLPQDDPVLASLQDRGIEILARFGRNYQATLEEVKPIMLQYLRTHPGCNTWQLGDILNVDEQVAQNALGLLRDEGLFGEKTLTD